MKVCAYCDRAAYVRVRHEGRPEWRCDWHQFGGRLPVIIRRGSFHVQSIKSLVVQPCTAQAHGNGGRPTGGRLHLSGFERDPEKLPGDPNSHDDDHPRNRSQGPTAARQMAQGEPAKLLVGESPVNRPTTKNRKEGGGDLSPVALTPRQLDLLQRQKSVVLDALTVGRQQRERASRLPSGELQTMFPLAQKASGHEADKSLPAKLSGTRSARVIRPKPALADWFVQGVPDGMTRDRVSGASWEPGQQILHCECGNRQDCLAPDPWDKGHVLQCRECGQLWLLVGPESEAP